MPTDAARSVDGEWRVDRRLLAGAALTLAVSVVAVFPLRLLPAPGHTDALLHATSGVALTLALAATVPRRDDAIAATVGLGAILFEPVEWFVYRCLFGDTCTGGNLYGWMVWHDTLLDIALAIVGAFVALVVIGRYQ